MKKLVLTLFLLSPSNAFCQIIVGETNINELKNVRVCQMVGSTKLLSSDIEISIDYGQERGKNYDGYILDPSTNKKRKFNSMVEAINFMESNGWTFINALALASGSNGNVYHFYFRKKE